MRNKLLIHIGYNKSYLSGTVTSLEGGSFFGNGIDTNEPKKKMRSTLVQMLAIILRIKEALSKDRIHHMS